MTYYLLCALGGAAAALVALVAWGASTETETSEH